MRIYEHCDSGIFCDWNEAPDGDVAYDGFGDVHSEAFVEVPDELWATYRALSAHVAAIETTFSDLLEAV